MLLSHLATGVRFFLHGPSVPMFGYPQSRCCQCPARRGAEVGGAQARQASRHVANPPLPAADATRMRLPAQRRRRRRTRSPSPAPYVRSLPLADAATLALCFPKSCRSLAEGRNGLQTRRTARENELGNSGRAMQCWRSLKRYGNQAFVVLTMVARESLFEETNPTVSLSLSALSVSISNHIASCSGEGYMRDDSVRLWDASTGEPIGSPLAGHRYVPSL